MAWNNDPTARRLRASPAITLCALLLAGAGAAVAAQSADGSIETRFQQERAVCLSGQSSEDRATCLKEAGAARDAARRGQLDTDREALARNARARCDALKGDDARDCLSRVRGEGSVSGDVRDGGILRETHTFTVGPMPAAPPAPH